MKIKAANRWPFYIHDHRGVSRATPLTTFLVRQHSEDVQLSVTKGATN